MSKIKIIILAVIGIASFGGAFGLTLLLKKAPAPASAATEQKARPASTREVEQSEQEQTISLTSDPMDIQRKMSEEMLKNYIDEIREKTREYKFREEELTEREKRIEIARVSLQEDVDRLVKLNAQLSLTLGDLKQQEQQLESSTVVVSAREKSNMVRIGATYDTMDVAKSSKIIITMAKNQQLADAVKILYYMSERNSGKLMGEIAATEPDLASTLSLELKKIKESE